MEITLEWLITRFESARGGNAANVRSMEGLRGFAVFLVFMVHFVTQIIPWLSKSSFIIPVSDAINRFGNSGVDLFFVLSGYLIYGSLISRPQNFFNFMSRRIQRIYPTFVVVFVIYFLFSILFPAESRVPSAPFAAFVYLLQNFLLLPGFFPIVPMITVAWSLSFELFFYLIIPLIIVLFGLRKRTLRWRIAFFLIIAVTIVGVGFGHGNYSRMAMFISGIFLFEAIKNRKHAAPKSVWGVVFLAIGILASIIQIPGFLGNAIRIGSLFISFFMVCYICFSNSEIWISRCFSWTPLRWLGNMSYSYYLIHGLALKGAFLLLKILLPTATHGAGLFFMLLPIMFTVTIFPSAILFLLVERPFSIVSGQHKKPV